MNDLRNLTWKGLSVPEKLLVIVTVWSISIIIAMGVGHLLGEF